MNIPLGEVLQFVELGALAALLFSPVAVWVFGKMKSPTTPALSNFKLVMPFEEWFWKLAAIAVIYPTLYFLLGYFVAWQFPGVRLHYSGSTELLGFWAHMGGVLTGDPWLLPFQMFRSLLWVLIALPIIRMMKGTWKEGAFAVALTFAVFMNSQHLLPNPYMPSMVRLAHFIETFVSNFIFGWLVVWVFCGNHSYLQNLFSGKGQSLN